MTGLELSRAYLAKARLRLVGIDPPRLHDVGPVLLAEQQRFPAHLRERIPTERYGPGDGARALAAAEAALELATMLIENG